MHMGQCTEYFGKMEQTRGPEPVEAGDGEGLPLSSEKGCIPPQLLNFITSTIAKGCR